MNWRWVPALPPVAWLAWGLMLRQVPMPTYLDQDAALTTGVFHVHSEASHDSTTAPRTLRAAAKQCAVQFVVLTDHNVQKVFEGDADEPRLLSWSELSTPHGHLIGLGSPGALERRLRRQPDAVAQLDAIGGLPIVAHPSDLKRPWTGPWQQVRGLEVVNVASAARRRGGPGLLGLLPLALAYPAAPRLALLQLIDRDVQALRLWDSHLQQPLVGLCGLDAHGYVPTAAIMQTWQLGLSVSPPCRAADADLSTLVRQALGAGRFFCYSALLGQRPRFRFAAVHRQLGRIDAAAELSQGEVEALEVVAPQLSVGQMEMVVWHNGQQIRRCQSATLRLERPPSGTYRVELWAELPTLWGTRRQLPVLYSNRLTLTPEEA
ncbi:MAG: hypothetical protein EOO40_01735 [Deltaproteobacteria bacterium]|nr:MAG: hypothetical protein EOO40_01735 [Deltaproteobacteria bacterium]